jgi:SAM-dependent methyltransferase
MNFLLLAVIAALGYVLYSLTQGAPYVPTLKKQAAVALDLMSLNKGDVIVDLGSGDGGVLIAAAKKGYRAVGIEINPLLYLISKFRTKKFKNIEVKLGNLYNKPLPIGTKGIFLFTAGLHVEKLNKWLRKEQKRLGHPLIVVSHGFEFSQEKQEKKHSGCFMYIIK